jgi:hypothetical protein
MRREYTDITWGEGLAVVLTLGILTFLLVV